MQGSLCKEDDNKKLLVPIRDPGAKGPFAKYNLANKVMPYRKQYAE